uniref:Craniofacial development protein 1 n=1 Tax=Anopheles epiroticus TaxID=199890 RepID=A0A182P593_9DIPT
MNQEDYPSDSDASDEDFRPDKEEADTGSELESNDEEPEDCDEQEKSGSSNGTSKRKRKSKPTGRKRTKADDGPVKALAKAHSSDEEKDEELDEEEEKRRTDALWADFLGGGNSSNSSSTNNNPKAVNGSTSSRSSSKTSAEVKKPITEDKPKPTPKAPEKEKPTVAQLFEFAGEQIVLTEDGGSKSLPDNDGSEKASPLASVARPGVPKPGIPARSASGGLGAVLNQLGKKNKLSTLEKTKLDWTSFKRQEGIEEELQTHNKGKDGFLERRDFLERTDLRQFEIEKSFRQTKRSNR